jgi:hypothetical protein
MNVLKHTGFERNLEKTGWNRIRGREKKGRDSRNNCVAFAKSMMRNRKYRRDAT